MQRLFPRSLVLVAVATLVVPSALATWYSHGTFEPDNVLDDPSYMRVDPPGTATDLIYFNVYTIVATAVNGAGVSPNAGFLQSANEVPVMESHLGILGVWIDCNGDGYVGLAEGAVREYPADLLAATDICPPVKGASTKWPAGAHNYNGWVSELVPIAGQPNGISANTTDLRRYDDPAAMIWGDVGTPTSNAGPGSCPLAPQPRGTWQSTGGALTYADCLADGRDVSLLENLNAPWHGRRLMGQDVPGLGVDPLGLGFADDDDAHGHAVWDKPTLGSENTSKSPAYIYDCDAEPTNVGDEANKTPLGPLVPAAVSSTNIYAVDPRLGDAPPTEWTIPAFLNHSFEGTNVSGVSVRASADCDTSNDRGADTYGNNYVFYVGETDFNPVSTINKREADFNFQFQFWGRGGGPLGFPQAIGTSYAGPAGMASPGVQSNWNPGRVAIKGDPNRVVRSDIDEGTTSLPAANHFTWYAHVGSATTSRGFQHTGGDGRYGSVQCPAEYEGRLNPNSGWNCDRDAWYKNFDGSPTNEVTPRARPGDPYQMRDVDCHDGRNALGVGLGTPAYGSGGCAPYVPPTP